MDENCFVTIAWTLNRRQELRDLIPDTDSALHSEPCSSHMFTPTGQSERLIPRHRLPLLAKLKEHFLPVTCMKSSGAGNTHSADLADCASWTLYRKSNIKT